MISDAACFRRSFMRASSLKALAFTGHRRPGMSKGLMLPEAERQAQEFEGKIRMLVVADP